MKKFTLFALALGLTFGVFAQKVSRTESMPSLKNQNIQFVKAGTTSMAKGVTVSPVQLYDYGVFVQYFDINLTSDVTSFYLTLVEGTTSDFEAALSQVGFSTLLEYCEAQWAQYETQGASYFQYWYSPEEAGTYLTSIPENSVVTVGVCFHDGGNGGEVYYTFETGDSQFPLGNAAMTVNKTDLIDDGFIEWNVNVNEYTSQYFFVCELNDAENALYWLNAGQAATEEESAVMDLEYLSSQYSSYVSYYPCQDVNQRAYYDLFSRTYYAEGKEYAFVGLPVNRDGDEGNHVYGKFTFGQESLNDAIEFASMSVYPNPATDYVAISSKYTIKNIEVVNLMGQVVMSNEVNATSVNINTSDLAKGTYILRAYADGMMTSKKLVVE